ncbi:MAG: DEAD/DEAH box helicase [Planctomycetota bacterium]
MKWTQLFGFQVDAINAWFDKKDDILLMANTASGKTEAAFLPILSELAEDNAAGSIRVIYIGPLKALINDQFQRLEELCRRSGIPVHRWHGDVGASRKKQLIKAPSGVLLITPESMESLLMRKGRDGNRLFKRLDVIVIDEIHVFIDSERERQLSSQINRIDAIRKNLPRTRRVGLSATIGDENLAGQWLSGDTENQTIIIKSTKSNEVELLLKTFIEEPVTANKSQQPKQTDNTEDGLFSVAEHILKNFFNKTNLVFCNRKKDVETLADILTSLCKRKKLQNEFMVHHGSLSKQFREDVESELKSSRPCTAICSSTLELGIDVGDIDSVGQVGPPHSVNALKQRIGRSGRRENKPSRLFMYVPVVKCTDKSSLPDQLYPELIQAIALVELMIGKNGKESWVEPPEKCIEDYSTLIQQTLSLIVERGGIDAREIYQLLCSKNTFGDISVKRFTQLLQDLGTNDLIEQTQNGEIILGLLGERLTSHYDFYAAFDTPTSYQVISNSGPVGTVEGYFGFYQTGQFMLLGGKRWRISNVDEDRKAIFVDSARGKKLVQWFGGSGNIHKCIREKMLGILQGVEIPVWLEQNSQRVLGWARNTFKNSDLDKQPIITDGRELHIFTWTGSRGNNTINMVFKASGLDSWDIVDSGICLSISKTGFGKADAKAVLSDFCKAPIDPVCLVKQAFDEEIPAVGKHGLYLSQELRARAYAAKYLDIPEALEAASRLLSSLD